MKPPPQRGGFSKYHNLNNDEKMIDRFSIFCLIVFTPVLLNIGVKEFSKQITRKHRISYYQIEPTQSDWIDGTEKYVQLADGTWVEVAKAGDYKYVAMSPDLKKYYDFGDSIYLNINKEIKGVYTIHDLTSRRIKNTIDVLVDAEYYDPKGVYYSPVVKINKD